MKFWKETIVPWFKKLGAGRGYLLAALALSLAAFALALRYASGAGGNMSPDEGNYIAMARRLLSEHVYSYWGQGPDAYVPPGFPLFLTACLALFGTGEGGLTAIRTFQCAMAGGTVLLTFLLGRAMTRRNGAGLFAAVLIGCNTGFYYLSRMFLTETLYFFLMMLSFVLLVGAEERDSAPRAAVAGVAFGGAVMTRSLVVAMLPFLLLPFLLLRRKDKSRSLRPLWLFAAGFLAVCLPWWIRNVAVLHQLVFWTTQTNPFFAGLARDVDALGLVDPGSYLGNFKLLWRLLRADPRGTLGWMSLGKFKIIFLGGVESVNDIFRAIAIFLGLGGAVLGLLSRRTRLQTLPFWIYFFCIFLSVPDFRYGYQYLPLLAIFGGWLLFSAWDGIHGQRNQRSPLDEIEESK